jgi:hypothetical protein
MTLGENTGSSTPTKPYKTRKSARHVASPRVADYRKLVIDDRETRTIWAGKRSRDAKRAAVTRRRNKEMAAEAVKMGIRGVEEELQNERFD